ncbi:MFS transporter [Algirhabdus cladophorae]|uniref:MFS transporter n=1 Tax=Algirhabdus cladophorae TaxID=3377108 RepID=UPI003B846D77
MTTEVSLAEAKSLPIWRQPIALLVLMAIAMPLAFSTWNAALNNFVKDVAGFDGADLGLLHSIREIPGFFAVGVIAVLLFMREQVLGLVSLVMLGAATAIYAWFPQMGGILTVTMISSIGFHYYETVNQSLQLQWIKTEDAPRMLGILIGVGSAATLVAYALIVFTWKTFDLSYNFVFMAGGGACAAIAIYCMFAFPQFASPTPQRKEFVLRRRYWLYYALQFMSGARRQIFMVFAGYMMVEKFGFELHQITMLYLVNHVINMGAAPLMGRAIGFFGERAALIFEYIGLSLVFALYACVYIFDLSAAVACGLYIVNHMFFSLALAIKTYFQKIADPADIAPTAAVAFTINHIAAVFLPFGLGLIWITSPELVFWCATGMALISLLLSLLIPRNPHDGHETVLRAAVAAPAE